MREDEETIVSEPQRVRPFYCGTQYYDWMFANCDRCTKGLREMPDGELVTRCEILDALSAASWDDGTVAPNIADRMGYADGETRYGWRCPEVVWTAKWKTEYCEKHPESEECSAWNNRKRISRTKRGQLELLPQ